MFVNASFASTVLVENVFSDIDSNYIYRDELQALYDRGTIVADESGRFNPDTYLNRDEFVGISLEVVCERCIQPHTEYQFIEEFFNEEVYFDIDNLNPYFYCVAQADKQNYVRGYDIGQECEDGSSQFGERPFCPLNRINLEEAVAVLLRNSGIFTIDDNQQVISDIYAGNISASLGNDVLPVDEQGNPYTFYGYLQKALDYEITEYDQQGSAKILKLLETDSNGNINPKKQITKEEFLRMSYIALKSNSCSEIGGEELALKMLIWDKTCQPDDINCTLSNLDDPEDTYDFDSEVVRVCESGIDDPTGYIWRFQNISSGEQFIRYGKYVDNYLLDSPGEWKIYLRIIDTCGNSSEAHSTIFVGDIPEDQDIDVDIDVYADECSFESNCEEIEFYSEDDDNDDIFDFAGDVETSCPNGEIDYDWTFTHIESGNVYNYTQQYIDDILLGLSGEWLIVLDVIDSCGQTGSEELIYIVPEFVGDIPQDQDIDVDIDVYADECSFESNCEEIEFYSEDDDNDDIFDFAGDVETSCPNGEIDYDWTFTHIESGNVYNYTQQYIDDILLGLSGKWLIVLDVVDGCGQTGSEELIYIVPVTNEDPNLEINDEYIDIDIDVYEDNCILGEGCEELEFDSQEDDGDDTYDFHETVDTSCSIGELRYDWEFQRQGSSEIFTSSDEYIDNFHFSTPGIWNIRLEVTDGCGQSASENMTYIVAQEEFEPYIDIDIDVYDDDCILGEGCEELEFDSQEDDGDDTYDFHETVDTSCSIGELRYDWEFQRQGSSEIFNFSDEYIDDFNFFTPGVWDIRLEVTDGCGQSANENMTYIVTQGGENSLNVGIIADPISGFESLKVGFEGIASGGIPPYNYDWSFDDGQSGFGKSIDHLYTRDGVYEVLLRVNDSRNNSGTASVVILVLDRDSCSGDSDGDGVVDCDDACPLVSGSDTNSGCPILEVSCTITCGCESGYTCSDSDPLTCGAGICVPDFDPKTSCLHTPGEGSIYGNALCSSCPCDTYLDFLADLRRCDLVFPAITSPDGKEIYSQGDIWQVQ